MIITYNGMLAAELGEVCWQKSWHSNPNGECVELAALPTGEIAMRNSRFPAGPVLLLWDSPRPPVGDRPVLWKERHVGAARYPVGVQTKAQVAMSAATPTALIDAVMARVAGIKRG